MRVVSERDLKDRGIKITKEDRQRIASSKSLLAINKSLNAVEEAVSALEKTTRVLTVASKGNNKGPLPIAGVDQRKPETQKPQQQQRVMRWEIKQITRDAEGLITGLVMEGQ